MRRNATFLPLAKKEFAQNWPDIIVIRSDQLIGTDGAGLWTFRESKGQFS
jgi:hypothetical protein